MKYRADIDGLRAVSVLAVILFHTGFGFASGGYVGVDIFFVISGYLITGLIFDDLASGAFTFAGFYKRRVARILPSLILTLAAVLVFGFLFYDTGAFDNLGKEIFFSALGAVNILFGQGVNYFAQEEAIRPLIHLWSLGVEEQFYLVWPTILILMVRPQPRARLLMVALLFSASLAMATATVRTDPIAAYFYPQYRAFELLAGAFTALAMRTDFFRGLRLGNGSREAIAALSLAMMLLPMALLSHNSVFPGLNTLWPCLGAGVYIALAGGSAVSRFLSRPILVGLGLISYPLYLYHQPIITWLQYFELPLSKSATLALVLAASVPLSYVTYKYVEKPIRRMAHRRERSPALYVAPLAAGLLSLALLGLIVAKSNGFEARFRLLNPFAHQVAQQSESSFHARFPRGMHTAQGKHGKILFVGDSTLQQYVSPFIKAMGIEAREVDTITRGGCVLLKGVRFRDKFSDISCNDLRERLYALDKTYDYVVISQDWDSYGDQVLNFPADSPPDAPENWEPFLAATLDHFHKLAGTVILIGPHIEVEGVARLKPTIFLTPEQYKANLRELKIANQDEIQAYQAFFTQSPSTRNARIIYPIDLFTDETATLHDENWSYFRDQQHISSASTEYVAKRLAEMIGREHP